MRIVIACLLLASLSFGAFTPPDSGNSGGGASVTYVDNENNAQDLVISTNTTAIADNEAAIALNTTSRTNMGNWAWVQDGTNLIAVYTP